jgi:chitin synthase
LPSTEKDINANYDKFIKELLQPKAEDKAKRDPKTKQEDYQKNFRTYVVLAWFLTNAILIVALTSPTVTQSISTVLKFTGSPNPTGNVEFAPYLRVSF